MNEEQARLLQVGDRVKFEINTDQGHFVAQAVTKSRVYNGFVSIELSHVQPMDLFAASRKWEEGEVIRVPIDKIRKI